MKIDDITVIIPSYKPSQELIGVVFKLSEEFERIVVVDDGGGKEYSKIFDIIKKHSGVEVVHHVSNQGKGRALKTAFNYCLLHDKAENGIITVDGDGQHKVEDVVKVAQELRKGENKVVLGCREFSDKSIPLRSRLGNNISKLVYRWACGLKLSDTQTGLRGIPKDLLPLCCRIAGEKYDYETNMLLTFKDSGVEFREVKIETVYENNNQSSHFNTIRDSAMIYAVLLKYSVSSLVAAIVDYSLFALFLKLGISIVLGTYFARAVSCVVNFLLNKRFVFRNDDKATGQFVKYLVLVAISASLSGQAVSCISAYFTISPIIIKIPIEIALYLFNYAMQRTFVFRKNE